MKFDRDIFYETYRSRFGSLDKNQVVGLNFMLDYFDSDQELLSNQIAYLLATTYHETGRTFEPIIERGRRSYFNKYEGRRNLGNVVQGDGFRYRGRGYVQITGRNNYEKFSRLLDIDLIHEPDLALLPDVAIEILTHGCSHGVFTGKALPLFVNKTQSDCLSARRVVNGMDRAKDIANYAKDFEAILRKSIILQDGHDGLF